MYLEGSKKETLLCTSFPIALSFSLACSDVSELVNDDKSTECMHCHGWLSTANTQLSTSVTFKSQTSPRLKASTFPWHPSTHWEGINCHLSDGCRSQCSDLNGGFQPLHYFQHFLILLCVVTTYNIITQVWKDPITHVLTNPTRECIVAVMDMSSLIPRLLPAFQCCTRKRGSLVKLIMRVT